MRKILFVIVILALILSACLGSGGQTASVAPTRDPLYGILETQIALENERFETQMAMANSTEMPTPESSSPTPLPEPTATAAATAEPIEDANNGVDVGEGMTLETEWFSGNIPAKVDPIKDNPDGCSWPAPACHWLHANGVLGTDDLAKASANDSAVWTGGANHQLAQGPEVGVLIPEGSYLTFYSISFKIVGGGYTLEFPEQGENTCMGFLGRGLHLVEQEDRHLPVTISKYGAVGAMVYTRYPVPEGSGQWFSQDYSKAQIVNAFDFDNAGIGDEDCETFYQVFFDWNDGSMVVIQFTEDNLKGTVLWTNVQED